MKKSNQLLIKIENLITEIDQPHPSIYFKKNTIQKKPSITHLIALRERLFDQNKLNQVRQAVENHQKSQFLNPEQEQHAFKVQNKTSIYLNSRNQKKPIYERVDEIQHKKMKDINKIREQYPNKQTRIEQQEKQVIEMMEERRKKSKKYSISQLQEKVKEHEQKQKQRLWKINSFIQLETQKENKKCTDKPFVRKKSIQMWKNYQDKQKLSNCVFARFEQYEVVRKQRFERKIKQYYDKVTPFAPIISQRSKKMVSQLSKKILSQDLDRSLSCRYLQRSSQKSLTNRHNKSTAFPTDRNS